MVSARLPRETSLSIEWIYLVLYQLCLRHFDSHCFSVSLSRRFYMSRRNPSAVLVLLYSCDDSPASDGERGGLQLSNSLSHSSVDTAIAFRSSETFAFQCCTSLSLG